MFVGQLKSTLKCTECNYKSPTFELFWHLAVPIPKKNSIDLHDCLAQFMLEEVLKGDNMPVSVAFEYSQQRLHFQQLLIWEYFSFSYSFVLDAKRKDVVQSDTQSKGYQIYSSFT